MTLLTWTVALGIAAILSPADKNLPDDKGIANAQGLGTDQPSAITTLTITRVKKPWYAWRSLVVGKMKQSVPEYQVVVGLRYKFFSLTENHKFAGGIYLWETAQQAKDWFSPAWFDRTEKKYGQPGTVAYYQVKEVNVAPPPVAREGNRWAVLSYATENPLATSNPSGAIVAALTLLDANGETCYISVWSSREVAEAYFENKAGRRESFDVPVWLNNAR